MALQASLRRTHDFNAFIAAVNHAVTQITDQSALLQRICDLAVEFTRVPLVWIGRPDGKGKLRFLAAAGPSAACLGKLSFWTRIVSCSPNDEAARVWTSGHAVFNADCTLQLRSLDGVRRAGPENLRVSAGASRSPRVGHTGILRR